MAISIGMRFQIAFLVGLFLFGLAGFYLLRMSLWNTYGEETIKLQSPRIEYEANYKWFKDGKKSISPTNLVFSINQIGYEEDKLGTLVVGNDNEQIASVVKMPMHQIEELINELKTVANNNNAQV